MFVGAAAHRVTHDWLELFRSATHKRECDGEQELKSDQPEHRLLVRARHPDNMKTITLIYL